MARRGWLPCACALAAGVALAFLLSDARAAQPAVYGINWDDVRATPEPTEVAVTGDDTCACDLTAGGCDGNCCCDSDCAAEELERLFSCDCTTGAGCEAEGPPAPSIEYCNDQATFHKVNLGGSDYGVVYKAASSGDFLSDQLCVTTDNNPSLGRFFSDPTGDGYTATQGAEDTIAAVAARSTAFADSAAEESAESDASITFKVGLPIPAFVGAARDTAVPAPRGGNFALPGTAFGATCVEGARPVRFMNDAHASACERLLNAGSCGVGGAFDASSFTSLFLATNGGAGDRVQVTISSVTVIDATDGTRNPVDLAGGVAIPTPVYDAVAATCTNAVSAVSYTVSYSSDGAISAVSVDVEVLSVTRSAVYVPVTYAATFENTNSPGIERPTSGMPGYDEGASVLAGAVAQAPSGDGRTAVDQFVGGLRIPGADETGACSPSASVAVRFGGSTVSQCKMSFTLDQLRTMCEGLSTDVVPPPSEDLAAGWFGLDGAAETYVATWADSNAHNIADWVEVLEEDPTLTLVSWNENDRACRNMPVGFKVQLLTALKGPQTDPQAKVAYARMVWSYGDWAFSDATAADAGASEDFYLSHAFETLAMAQDPPAGVLPSNPPLLPKLDSGVLYPFNV
eukprot:PRCOL_00001348-RA